jgi:hypothetical protein
MGQFVSFSLMQGQLPRHLNLTNGRWTMRVKIKGINKVAQRLADGTKITYYYAWKGGPCLPGKPGDPEFVAAYTAAVGT